MLSKGAQKNLIIDLQRNKIFSIPKSFGELINESEYTIDINLINNRIKNKASVNAFNKFLTFLIANELGFYCNKKDIKRFPIMSKEWNYPAIITNCIFDLNEYNLKYFSPVFLRQLEKLSCYHIQIRIYECFNIQVDQILDLIEKSNLETVELILPFRLLNQINRNIKEFISCYNKVKVLTVFSSNENKLINFEEFKSVVIIKTVENIKNKIHCGIVQLEQFPINVTNFTESLHHNSCLNRKISIDAEGNIKNCPSMTESFGNIRDTTLAEAIEKPGFKKYWDINKDKIHVCKDCEFRYICTDCRAYVEDPEDILSKPLKCGYNPYTGEWSEWSTNPLKQKAIDFYGMREMVDDMKKAETPE